ncbi:MAG: LytTR family transcriptional regulator [Alistipes sp.]|nr:LytTR family transcriptional regulator [Alistipes sp.]
MKMNRNLLDQSVPKSMLTYYRQALTVIAMAVIAVVFIIIFRPFNIYESLDFIANGSISGWIDSTEDAYILALSSVVLLAALIIMASRIVLVHNRRHSLSYRVFLLWCGIEFLVVALGITIWSATFFHQEYTSIFRLFSKVLGRTTCILFIPYAFMLLYTIIVDKAHQLKTLKESIANDDEQLQKTYILLYDEHNEMRLSVKREDLIMIESADNYICAWYMNNGQIKKMMIRNTLKRVAQQLSNCSIQRCHRSYMINMDRVKVLRRDKEGVFIEFGIEGVFDVPISKTYIDNITKWLMK